MGGFSSTSQTNRKGWKQGKRESASETSVRLVSLRFSKGQQVPKHFLCARHCVPAHPFQQSSSV